MIAEIPALAGRYPDYASYAGESVQELFSEGELSDALELRATRLESMIFWNEPEGFRGEPLPARAQLAPMYAVRTADLTGNGSDDILIGGNLYDVKPQAGPYDASRGTVISYHDGRLGSWPPEISGISTNGEIRNIRLLTINGETHIVISRYDDQMVIRSLNGN
jgi:hypothetical protein